MWVRKSQQEEVWAELLETTAFSIAPPKWRPKLSQRNNFYFLSCNLSERQSSFLLPIQTNGVLGGPRHVVASSSSLITPLHPKMCIPMLLFSVSTPKNHQYLFRMLSLAWMEWSREIGLCFLLCSQVEKCEHFSVQLKYWGDPSLIFPVLTHAPVSFLCLDTEMLTSPAAPTSRACRFWACFLIFCKYLVAELWDSRDV